jgi:hypothetical protein
MKNKVIIKYVVEEKRRNKDRKANRMGKNKNRR